MPSSQYYASAKLNWLRGTAFPSALSSLHISLHTANPGASGSTGDVTTATVGGRTALSTSNLSAPTIAASGGFQVSNTTAVLATNSALASNTITYVGLWDAATGGNFITYGVLTNPANVAIGDVLRFGVGQIVIREL